MPGPPPPPPPAFAVSTTAIPDAFIGTPFSFLMQAVNGTPPYVGWFIGEIDPDSFWLGIDPATGQLIGNPRAVESGQVAIGVFDSAAPQNYAQIILPFSVLAAAAAAITDYTTLITSEHKGAPKFLSLVDLLANGVGGITATADTILGAFDVDTAVGAQLDVVGQWVGIGRTLALALNFFGFADTPGGQVFGELGRPVIGGPFYELGNNYQGNTLLSDVQYRQIIRTKIAQNQAIGNVTDLENALAAFLGAP